MTSSSAGLRVDAITIFPDYLAPLRESLIGRAVERGQLDLRVHDLRAWTDDVHRTVDDTPYGGGPGMVMLPEPWGRALDEVVPAEVTQPPTLVVPSPAGRRFDHATAQRYAGLPWLVFACGRYEGIDARVLSYASQRMPVEEVSLGDYVLAGGEVAVLVIMEAVGRLLPGVLGNSRSAVEDSFADGADGLLEAPAYTKPADWRGLAVPPVLLSGNHGEIARWRRERSVERTARMRPDLLPDEPVSPDPS